MSGITLKHILFIITCVEAVILNGLLFSYLLSASPKNRLRIHFFLLVGGYVAFNLIQLFLMPQTKLLDKGISMMIIYGSGIVLSAFFISYLVKEFGDEPMKFPIRNHLVIALSGSYLAGIITVYLFSGYFELIRILLIPFPMFLSLVFIISFIKQIGTKSDVTRSRGDQLIIYSGYIGILFTTAVPLVSSIGNFLIMHVLLINILFLITTSVYLYRLYNENQKGMNFKENDLSKYNLTERQMEIAELLLQGVSFEEIAEKLHIEPSTVRKHASDVYRETNITTRTKEEFIQKFRCL